MQILIHNMPFLVLLLTRALEFKLHFHLEAIFPIVPRYIERIYKYLEFGFRVMKTLKCGGKWGTHELHFPAT